MKPFQKSFTGTIGYNYLLFLPEGYLDSTDNRPLILFLHGAGERGNDLEKVKRHGIPKIVETWDRFPFIAVSPQCPANQYWLADLLNELLDEIEGAHRIDTDRVYLTGISMGGYAAWQTAIEYPDRFAAIAPVCGGGNPDEVCRIRHVPVWAFHGAKDPIVPLSESEEMVNALRKCGGDARLTVYPEAGHDSWTETYNNPGLYEWFMSHSRLAVRPMSGGI